MTAEDVGEPESDQAYAAFLDRAEDVGLLVALAVFAIRPDVRVFASLLRVHEPSMGPSEPGVPVPERVVHMAFTVRKQS